MHCPKVLPGSTTLGTSLDSERFLGCQLQGLLGLQKLYYTSVSDDFAFIAMPILARAHETELAYELHIAIKASRMHSLCIVMVYNAAKAVKAATAQR